MNEAFYLEPVRGAIGDMALLDLNGLELMRGYVRREHAPPPIHHLIGLTPTSVGPGTTTWSMPITPWLMDWHGTVFGGVYALFADAPLGTSLFTTLGPGMGVATTEISISYVRPTTADTGNLIGRGSTVHTGRGTGISSVHIEDRHGRLLAHGTTRCVFTKVPFEAQGEPIPLPDPDVEPPDPYLRPIETPNHDLSVLLEKSPLDLMVAYRERELPRSPIDSVFGAEPISATDGTAELTMPASPWFSSGLPTMYGGVIAWALDYVLTGAIYSSLDVGCFMANLDLKVRFLRPAMLDMRDLHLAGEVVHRGRTVRTGRAEMTDADGKRVALATGSAMVLPNAARQLIDGRTPTEIIGT